MKKIFIDGREGTTGLGIFNRISERKDLDIIILSEEKRKDREARRQALNSCDIAILCLPDAASREAVEMIENPDVIVIDASTAHRTSPGWTYGLPELSSAQYEAIKTSKRIAVPGCHASGFITLVRPLIECGALNADVLLSCYSLTGYSGGGKKMIAEYEGKERAGELDAPRQYALSQEHKHLKEMRAITGLKREPLFSPIVADYYSGMTVSVPVYNEFLKEANTPLKLQSFFADFYAGQQFVQVAPVGAEEELHGKMLAGNGCAGWDGLKIYITGNGERTVLSAQFDNLGKGASGAAIQCLNVMLGCAEDKGLNL